MRSLYYLTVLRAVKIQLGAWNSGARQLPSLPRQYMRLLFFLQKLVIWIKKNCQLILKKSFLFFFGGGEALWSGKTRNRCTWERSTQSIQYFLGCSTPTVPPDPGTLAAFQTKPFLLSVTCRVRYSCRNTQDFILFLKRLQFPAHHSLHLPKQSGQLL